MTQDRLAKHLLSMHGRVSGTHRPHRSLNQQPPHLTAHAIYAPAPPQRPIIESTRGDGLINESVNVA